MLIIKKLKIKGFRGYLQEQEFYFNNPVIILFGKNHCGKSSALNAVEWCLYGNDCTGKNTGIRERINWEIPNRNLASKPDVYVELELEDRNKGSYKIARRWVSSRKTELKINAPDGQFQETQAEEKLTRMLKLSFQDFLTSVYQHQEAVRAILTQEPAERNEAIDRLLGLSDYRNILSGIEAAKIHGLQKEMGSSSDHFKNMMETALRTRANDLKDMKLNATKKGLKEEQLTEETALRIAAASKKKLEEFAIESGLGLAEISVPDRWKDLPEFRNSIEGAIKKFRSEMPDVKNQKDLFERRTLFTKIKTEYDSKKSSLKDIEKELSGFVKENGSEDDLNRRKSAIEKQIYMKEKEMSEVNAKSAAIGKAIEYLKLEEAGKNICPVCGKETADLLQHLEAEWKEKHEAQVGKINEEVNKLKSCSKDIEISLNRYREFKEKKENISKAISEANKEISKLLGRTITEEDDSAVLIGAQVDRIEEELKKLEDAVKSKQKTLDGLSMSSEQIQVIVDILTHESKKEIVERVMHSPEYRQMEELKDKMALLVYDTDKIKDAINSASNEDAKGKIDLAKATVDNFFRKIANNPAVSKVNLHVTPDSKGKNNYEFNDQHGKELSPVLSQGDLNALALSIFLGMAYLKGADQPCGFIMMDDPSQSLGSEHKEKLVSVIEEVLANRMVILSTMDKELRDLVLSKITKAKTQYVFEDWTPAGGPEIRME